MSLPIIFWTIPEIRQNPMRKKYEKNMGRGVELILDWINIWYLQTLCLSNVVIVRSFVLGLFPKKVNRVTHILFANKAK